MGKYCCFLHAVNDYKEKNLDDVCTVEGCNRKYGFPLYNYPKTIKNPENQVEYVVEKPLARGFYGATYLCKRKNKFFSYETLLKVTPTKFYTEFPGKDFAKEIELHNTVSKDADFLVALKDAFVAEVQFGNDVIECYIAELEYIEGVTLEDYVKNENNITPRKLAQIAIDLLYIWDELIRKNVFHNDLHEGNLMVQSLSVDKRRANALSPNIRLVAIDLGSAADESLSNVTRTGDQEFISRHIGRMANLLRAKTKDASSTEDSEWRLIELLDQIAEHLTTHRQNIDLPNIEDYTKQIRGQFDSAISYAPWTTDFSLSQFSEGINAQTIHSCNTTQLLVDPEGTWISEIQIAGPQLIVGMRGCGKTMLLSALDIHARLEGEDPERDTNEGKIERVKKDTFVAIKASCKSIIYNQALDNSNVMFETLFWKYAIEIIRAAKHLTYLDRTLVKPDYYMGIVSAFEAVFGVRIPASYCISENELEKFLYLESSKLYGKQSEYRFCRQTEEAFDILAITLVNISEILIGKKVFFLLDDASTRYLQESQIKELLKTLIFQSPSCAFKITTERQTLDLGIHSPGDEEIADELRDYNYFDLGAKVYEKTRKPAIGKKFIADILNKRKRYYKGHPNCTPIEILGDEKLSEIAKTIWNNPGRSSNELKKVYHGLSAVNALCVGDIGDTIKLYEMILEEYNTEPNIIPVSRNKQTQCFQILCSRRIYNLENRNAAYQKYALSFAEANHELLIKSNKDRLRQYTSLYVRITSNADRIKQSQKLRELIDAGIFVFADSGTPRTKTRDTNPMLQFKLVYRKLFGISNYIGLSNRDRFELSGNDLANWLENPTKEALLKYAIESTEGSENDDENMDIVSRHYDNITDDKGGIKQLSFFDINPVIFAGDNENSKSVISEAARSGLQVVPLENIPEEQTKRYTILIMGLGFEECSVDSTNNIFSTSSNINEVLLIKYNELGYRSDIYEIISNSKFYLESGIQEIYCEELDLIRNFIVDRKDKYFIVDITALNKPVIFVTIRTLLINRIDFLIVHTKAEQYFPLENDITKAFLTASDDESAGAFNKLMGTLYVGEEGPYCYLPLIEICREISTRPSALIGVLPAKNQRLISFLENSDYECIQLLCQKGESPSAKLAGMAGQIVQTNYDNAFVIKLDLDAPEEFANYLQAVYQNLYSRGNMNIDLAITGSKMNAVICAAFTTINRINQCWYVQPKKYDTKHFSIGVNKTEYYKIQIPIKNDEDKN